MLDGNGQCSRRQFVAGASCFGAYHALARLIPLPAIPAQIAADSRIGPVIADAGFASVRKIGDGAYAIISNPSKGSQTTCNGGFLIGKDAALLIEGFNSPAGASFQMNALRIMNQIPVRAAVETHYHYDHSMGNSFYGASGIPLWAHAATARRIVETYGPMQSESKATILAPYERRVKAAKSDIARGHAQSDVDAMDEIFGIANANILSLPNHPLDPATLPLKVDLGGLAAVVESYPGHSGTDIVVRVPEQNLVYTGDLLFNGKYPVCFDEKASVSEWRQTLKTFAGFGKDTLFVPGHGQIGGQEAIAVTCNVFDDIAAQAQPMYAAGVPLEEAESRYVVPERFKNLLIWSWGFTIGSAIALLYGEWKAGKS